MKSIIAAVLLSFCATLPALADEALKIKADSSLPMMLAELAGKTVTLHLRGGDSLTGKLAAVGGKVVHLSELSGKEFYDGVIALEAVDAIEVRARSR